jgi:hypothetical protein
MCVCMYVHRRLRGSHRGGPSRYDVCCMCMCMLYVYVVCVWCMCMLYVYVVYCMLYAVLNPPLYTTYHIPQFCIPYIRSAISKCQSQTYPQWVITLLLSFNPILLLHNCLLIIFCIPYTRSAISLSQSETHPERVRVTRSLRWAPDAAQGIILMCVCVYVCVCVCICVCMFVSHNLSAEPLMQLKVPIPMYAV